VTDEAPSARAFEAALDAWLKVPPGSRRKARADGVLQRLYKDAWRNRSARVRQDVLLYLAQARLEEGKSLILAGLRSRSEGVRIHALNAANMYMIRGCWEPDARTSAAVARIVERDTDWQFRLFAFHVLQRIRDTAATSAFERIAANDAAPGWRIEANLELLQRGQKDALQALFAEQRKHRQSIDCFPEAREIVERLGLPLSRREADRLDRLATKAIEYHRARLREPRADEFDRIVAARFLSLHCEPRDPLEDADIDAMGNLALKPTRTDTVPVVKRALERIDSRLARRWLKKLGGPLEP
jgi:hypothetical protein